MKTIPTMMGLLLLCLSATTIANAERLDRTDLFVKDGDTIIVGPPYDKHDNDQEYRLVGFDTPETARGKCPAEIEKGNRAAARLIALLDSAKRIELIEVQCSCKTNAQKCNFGRRCGVLTVDDRDVGAILIEANLAVPFICHATGLSEAKKLVQVTLRRASLSLFAGRDAAGRISPTSRPDGRFALMDWTLLMHAVDASETVTENPAPIFEYDLSSALYFGRQVLVPNDGLVRKGA